ncbi:MAG: SbmA/BacA-like family transporter, partial [Pseudomonadota bacterium]
ILDLARIAASGPGAPATLGLLAIVIGLELFSIWIELRFVTWNADFFNALEAYDATVAVEQVGVFFALTALSAGRFLISDYLRKFIIIRWRTRLTDHALSLWLANKSYWHLREGLAPEGLENPDQRIAEDCRLFVSGLLREALDLFTRIIGLFSYVTVLWSLSTFALEFSVFGLDMSIPHYLVWTSFIYVLLSSIFTHVLGWPLKGLLFERERREADFRYSLVQLRDNAAEVAIANGEAAERDRIDERFSKILVNWRRLIGREFIVGLFTRPYRQTVLRIPIFLSLPAYLAREVTLGGLMQLASAFSRVTTTLSWFIFSYRDLANFVAVSDRLGGLLDRLGDPGRMPDVPSEIEWLRSGADRLEISGLKLFTPDGRSIVSIDDLSIAAGERVWLRGPSGIGKTTLLRALAGIWPYGQGSISLPDQPMFFASQNPYLFGDGIASALTYPDNNRPVDLDRLTSVLLQVGLQHRSHVLEQDRVAALEGLSEGEKQRLVFARILLAKPKWLILDEPTSALGPDAEAELFGVLRALLPKTTIICVAHHPPAALKPVKTVKLGIAGADKVSA